MNEPRTCRDPVSRRAKEIPSFIAMDVLETAQAMERGGEHIVHLEVGEPDFDTPDAVRRAAIEALSRGETHYTHSLGLYELRAAIAAHYRARYGVDMDPTRVVVTSGSSPGFFLVFAALLDPGDEVVLTDPHYACYPTFVDFCGGAPVFLSVREEEAFQFVPDELARALGPRTKAVLVNSPSNPTGTLLSGARMAEVARVAEASGAYVVSDEIYHGLVYEGREHSILEFTDRAFVVNGFSKLYAMTGWRLGYLIVPPEFVRPVQKIQQNFFISANAFVQRAGIAALAETAEDVARMVATYGQRRCYMIDRLERMGFSFRCHPTGAFYVFVNARHLSTDSYRLAFDILEKARVGCTPGVDFGAGGEGYLRFTYANSLENIKEGLDRLERYLDVLGRRGA
ncbi:MAG: pyridoxal phosphate-dependent aminotransferase [Deltaproteobacteria bacterium]|nr:pyridoxal phosphate-dependent aminotransferase [Deltaproteobacteria bacterium]